MNPAPCPACFLEPSLCLCSLIPRVETKTRFVILRHVVEAAKRTNSARIAALALPRCEIVDYGGKTDGPPGEKLAGDGTWLLFPGGEVWDGEGPRPKRLVVLDGSWRQAKRMLQRVPELGRMKRFSLAGPGEKTERLRKAAAPEAMATLEAMAWAVEKLEGEGAGGKLRELFRVFVERNVVSARKAGRRLAVRG